jgi:hypothetical protein
MFAGIPVPEQFVVTIRQRVGAAGWLAILTVPSCVIRTAQDDISLVTRRPLLDLPCAGLDRIGKEEMQMERADVGLVPDFGGRLPSAVVDLHGPVVTRGVDSHRRRWHEERHQDES